MLAINLIAISISLFFVFAILQKKGKNLSDFHLLSLILLIVSMLANDIWVKSDLNQVNFLYQTLVEFLIFPVFISYALTLIGRKDIWSKSKWWLSIYLISSCLYFTFDILSNDYTQSELDDLYFDPKLSYHFFYKTHKIFVTFSIIWYYKHFKRYILNIKTQFTYIEKLKLDWLKIFLVFYVSVVNLSNIFFLLYNFGVVDSIDVPFIILNSSLLIGLFLLSYKGIFAYGMNPEEIIDTQQAANPDISKDHKQKVNFEAYQQLPDQVVASNSKYSSSSLSKFEMERISQEFEKLIENEKLYLQNDLQMKDISERLGVSSHKISQSLSTINSTNLFDIISDYRVAHLKNLLIDPHNSKYTILALGLESGFNSKSSLNRVFKNKTGQTPLEYKKSQIKESAII